MTNRAMAGDRGPSHHGVSRESDQSLPIRTPISHSTLSNGGLQMGGTRAITPVKVQFSVENVGGALLPVFDRDGQKCPSYGKGCISRHFAPLQGWDASYLQADLGPGRSRGRFRERAENKKVPGTKYGVVRQARQIAADVQSRYPRPACLYSPNLVPGTFLFFCFVRPQSRLCVVHRRLQPKTDAK